MCIFLLVSVSYIFNKTSFYSVSQMQVTVVLWQRMRRKVKNIPLQSKGCITALNNVILDYFTSRDEDDGKGRWCR